MPEPAVLTEVGRSRTSRTTAPLVLGGLVLAARTDPPTIRRLPAPAGVVAVLLHPAAEIRTKEARALLGRDVPLGLVVEHSRRIAALVAGCAANDRDLIRAGLEDVLIEPQREHLLPALPAVKAAAIGAGARPSRAGSLPDTHGAPRSRSALDGAYPSPRRRASSVSTTESSSLVKIGDGTGTGVPGTSGTRCHVPRIGV